MKTKFLHPSKFSPQLSTKSFQRLTEGTTKNGTRIQRIESNDPSVSGPYRHGIIVEPPSGKPFTVFGSYNEINEVTLDIKSNPDKVLSETRPLAASPHNTYYLNAEPPSLVKVEVDSQTAERRSAANAVYPHQGSETRPLTRTQIQDLELKTHLSETIPLTEDTAKPKTLLDSTEGE